MKPIHWRRSKFGRYLRHLPRLKHFRGTWLHRKLGDRFFSPDLWQPSRQKFCAGFAVGAFFAIMPAPFQMLAAALIAYFTRVNIPAAMAATWITNPLTFPAFLYLQYRAGSWILGTPAVHDIGSEWMTLLKSAPLAIAVGTPPVAIVCASLSYFLSLRIYDRVVSAIEHHRLHRRAKKESCSPEKISP